MKLENDDVREKSIARNIFKYWIRGYVKFKYICANLKGFPLQEKNGYF